jgi:hypothetical protein
MNTEHTAETWTAYQNPEDIGSNLWHIRVAEGLGGSMRGYCGKPRADLIAAAPDLLAALKEIAALNWANAATNCAAYRAHNSAAAAIAKAEGKA